MDDAAWAALTLSLTVAGGIWTWLAFRNRGLVSGARALGFTLLPLAAYLTETLRMFTGIAQEISAWATRLVFSPRVWLGIVIAGVAVVLIVVSGMARSRQLGKAGAGKAGAAELEGGRKRGLGRAEQKPAGQAPQGAAGVDAEMAEIEALLRKRGIS